MLMVIFVCPLWAQENDDETGRFAKGLRERRLFKIAEDYCQLGLRNKEIDATTEASLIVELIRTQTARATVTTGDARAQTWQAAQQTVSNFLSNHPGHPRELLIEVQGGLSYLTHGRLIRQEIEAEIAPPNQAENALAQLRKATAIFEECQRKIQKLIPERRGRNVGAHQLTADQLISLNNNVRFQSAVSGINRAQLYPKDDKLNRIDALNVGIQKLESVRRETNPEYPLWWQTELQRAKCFRLLGKLDETQKVLRSLPLEQAIPAMRQAVVEEQIRLVIATRRLNNAPAIVEQVLELNVRQPQLDLAVVELMMQLAMTGPGDWKSRAAQQLKRIEDQHGPYWGLRAELLVIGSSSSNRVTKKDPSDPSPNSPDLLIRIGEQAVRKNRLTDAKKAFQQAANMARKSNSGDVEFITTVKLAQVMEKTKREPRSRFATRLHCQKIQ